MRLFQDGDAAKLAALTLAAIEHIGPAGYSDEQISVWAARHTGPERFLERAASGSRICVAADDADQAVAYALLEPDGHLDMLYCDPAHSRKGLADQLLQEAAGHARSIGLRKLYTEASELARPAFQRAGYVQLHRRDFELAGVAIHNYAMECAL